MSAETLRLGIDLGGTKIEGVLVNQRGDVIARHRLPTPQGDYDQTIRTIDTVVHELTNDANLPLGIGTPGSISRLSPLMRNANSTCLNDKPLVSDLEMALKRPVRIANDADCFTLSEATDGAGKGANIVFGVILGTGVGGGICIDGTLIAGLNGIAGEWGHNPLPLPQESNRACYCGRANCVESWLSGPALQKTALDKTGEPLAGEEIAARIQDPGIIELMSGYCENLAAALAVVINIIDPDKIVLGGGLSNLDVLYNELPKHLDKFVFSDNVATEIVPAVHGDSSGVRGAAWLW